MSKPKPKPNWQDDYAVGSVVYVEFKDQVGNPPLRGIVAPTPCDIPDAIQVILTMSGGEVRERAVHRSCLVQIRSYKVGWGADGRVGQDSGGQG